MTMKAIFLDRDGVILQDNELISSPSHVHLFEHVGDSIAMLRELGYKIIMVSNQTVVSRGILSYEEMLELNNFILDKIKIQNKNALFDGLYFSHYHPNATIEKYRKDSECRKPRPGMLLHAQADHGIDLENSIMIGDRPTDIYAGKSVGCLTILLLTGNENGPLIESSLALNPAWLVPHYKFQNLFDAAQFILKWHQSPDGIPRNEN